MKKFRPNQGQSEVLNALAHCLMAQQFDQNIEGMTGFFNTFINQSGNEKTKQIWDEFSRVVKLAKEDFLKAADADKQRNAG